MELNDKIFRQYDIRGIWGKDLTPDIVRRIAVAYACYFIRLHGERFDFQEKRPKITIGRDIRLSSPEMTHSITETLLDSGFDVIDLGVCPTPLQYFSLYRLDADGGIMVTASHNPPEFNGLKLSIGKDTLFGEYITTIRDIAKSGLKVEEIMGRKPAPGKSSSFDIISAYRERMKEEFKDSGAGIKVVIDSGNGTAGLVAPLVLKDIGTEVIELFSEPDGRFPNHEPDPVVLENLTQLIDTVKKEKAHFGVGYDGDADRIGVVSSDGEIIWGDKLLVIFSRAILRERPGSAIIGEVKCSQTLFDDIRAHGGVPVMWKTGHSLIKAKMKETGAVLAGEMSGHMFFKDRYYGYDDAIYATLRLVEIVNRTGRRSLKELLHGLPEVISTPEIRFECPDEIKFKVVEKVKEYLRDYEIIDIDGVRIKTPEGWGLVRASNTQPALVMRFEARDQDSLDRIRETVEGALRKAMEEIG
ncbi:MAG: phosphomannomutase/phosphoglucomutase [Thermodesulfovibrionales bacterium]|nr:phosphomannomutase/phosphoglucomutase [Thermodesulfovibrionales bacterium]